MILKWFSNKSLRFKINTFVVVFTLLIGLLGITMLLLAHHYLKEELINRGAVMVRRLAESHSYHGPRSDPTARSYMTSTNRSGSSRSKGIRVRKESSAWCGWLC